MPLAHAKILQRNKNQAPQPPATGAQRLARKLETANYSAEMEPCPDTGGFIGEVRGHGLAYSEGETKGELLANLKEALALALEEENPGIEINHTRLNITLP